MRTASTGADRQTCFWPLRHKRRVAECRSASVVPSAVAHWRRAVLVRALDSLARTACGRSEVDGRACARDVWALEVPQSSGGWRAATVRRNMCAQTAPNACSGPLTRNDGQLDARSSLPSVGPARRAASATHAGPMLVCRVEGSQSGDKGRRGEDRVRMHDDGALEDRGPTLDVRGANVGGLA